jgi:hypothetical protein
MFPASEEHEMFAIEGEGRYPVAHGFCGFRCRCVYCLPHVFKGYLDFRRKGRDVFVNRREALFVCHLYISFRPAAFIACQAATTTHKQLERTISLSAHPSNPSTPAGSRIGAC